MKADKSSTIQSPHLPYDNFRLTARTGFQITIVAIFLLAGALSPVWGQDVPQIKKPSLQSSLLELQLSLKRPFSYQLIEKSTGRVIVSRRVTLVRLMDATYPLTTAEIVGKTDKSVTTSLDIKDHVQKARAEFTFTSDDVLEVLLTCDQAKNIKETFDDRLEHYYGLWEYPLSGNVDNRGACADMHGLGELPHNNWCNARAPFYVTSRNYGIYVDTMAKGHYSIANAGITGFDFDAHRLKYYIIYGQSYDKIFEHFNRLAGPSVMPPDWAFDSIWWRNDHHEDYAPHVSNSQENALDDANQLRAHKIPAAAMWIDRPFTSGEKGWGNMDFDSSFPDPKTMIQKLNRQGYQLLVWITNRCINNLYDEAMAKGYLFTGYSTWPAADMRKPDAYNWFKEKLDVFVKMGIKGYKVDRGAEGEMPDSLQNQNVYLFMKMASEGQKARHGNDHYIFARNAFDKSRRYVGIWNGDTDSTFDGLAISVKNGLRCGAINFPMFGSDTGGYFGPVSKELFARWLQFSTYCTMMEVMIGPERTIWYDYDHELIDIARNQCIAHHELIPYTRSYMYRAVRTGMPVMRQLIFAFPDDQMLYDMFDEYLYGRDILVAPVLQAGQTSRSVYLPQGKWLNYNDKKTVYTGPTTIQADAPLDAIPLFVRAGAIIPRGDVLKSNNDWTQDWKPYLNIEVFPVEKGSSSFQHYTGQAVKVIHVSLADNILYVNFSDLDITGKLQVYCTSFGKIKLNGEELTEDKDFTYSKDERILSILYSGATSLEVQGLSSIFAHMND